MSDQIGCLGQSFPAANTATQLYQCQTGASAVISTIYINNQSSSNDNFWISVRVNGAADTPAQYLQGAGSGQTGGGVLVEPTNPIALTLGITLGPGDQIWVKSLNGTSSFQIFGDVVTNS